jgi:hypothetical protein
MPALPGALLSCWSGGSRAVAIGPAPTWLSTLMIVLTVDGP